MTDHDVLHADLHSLADELAPDPTAARDRARHAVAHRARRRHALVAAAVSGGAVVAAVAVVAGTIAIARDHDDSQGRRPVGTVQSTPTTLAASTITTNPAPSTTTPPAASPIHTTVPDQSTIPAAVPAYALNFPWGRGVDEVAFSVPNGEGASGGPLAFTADRYGNVLLLDHSNARTVSREKGGYSVSAIPGLTPAVTAAAFDRRGHEIVASVDAVSVYGPDGQLEGSWPHITDDPHGIYELEVDGTGVYWRHGSLHPGPDGPATRTLLLRDNGSGYVAATGAPSEPDAITGVIGDDLTTFRRRTATGMEYRITTSGTDVWAARALPDGSFVFVLQPYPGDAGAPETRTYIVGYIDRAGHASYSTVDAPLGYLVNGPVFDINDDGVAVMSSTISGGVTVSYYRYP